MVLIAGGVAKGVDLGALGPALGPVRHLVALGQAADELAGVAHAHEIAVTTVASMEEAVAAAARVAQPGDAVLLAPACASFDLFRDYADRGDRFAALARAAAREGRDGRR